MSRGVALWRPVVIAFAAALITTANVAECSGQDTIQSAELSQQETERRVKAEAARRLGLRAEDVRIVEVKTRIWPDAGLGCNARRGVLEASPVDGFRIVVEAAGRRLIYHTDRHGRLIRCATPSKPIDRIK